jgi:hypothetical protein
MRTHLTMTGLTPLVMHNARLADPLDEVTQALASLTSKRSKTLADIQEIADVEWKGSLYWDSETQQPYLPADALMRSLHDAATAWKLGESVWRGVHPLEEHLAVHHDGPKTLEALAKDKQHRWRRTVVVNRNRTARTRPIFRRWSIETDLELDETELSPVNLARIVERAGRIEGVGTARKLRQGRFAAALS